MINWSFLNFSSSKILQNLMLPPEFQAIYHRINTRTIQLETRYPQHFLPSFYEFKNPLLKTIPHIITHSKQNTHTHTTLGVYWIYEEKANVGRILNVFKIILEWANMAKLLAILHQELWSRQFFVCKTLLVGFSYFCFLHCQCLCEDDAFGCFFFCCFVFGFPFLRGNLAYCFKIPGCLLFPSLLV